VLEPDGIQKVCDTLLGEFNKGLSKDTHHQADIHMLPTYLQQIPDGTEHGIFLSVDLGGTNFRTLMVIKKDNHFSMNSQSFSVSTEIMQGTGEMLFDLIAGCVTSFLLEHKVPRVKIPLGFTFSFPMVQEGINKARLIRWTKGFKCSGVEGEDVVELLNRALAKRPEINVECVAILNDTTGTLASCATMNRSCRVGLIIGTGCNLCYVESLDHVELWDGPRDGPNQVVIDTEWGAFGDNGCLDFVRTEFDREIDRQSLHPGMQLFEKMISGMYLGELLRLVLLKLTDQGLLFDGHVAAALRTPHTLLTKHISQIESDSTREQARQILDELGIGHATEDDLVHVKYVCSLISRRAAYLAAAGVATTLNKINKTYVTVAVDGSVYRLHPHVHRLMEDKIGELINPGIEFELRHAEDGSGRGAAFVAGVVAKSLNWKYV